LTFKIAHYPGAAGIAKYTSQHDEWLAEALANTAEAVKEINNPSQALAAGWHPLFWKLMRANCSAKQQNLLLQAYCDPRVRPNETKYNSGPSPVDARYV